MALIELLSGLFLDSLDLLKSRPMSALPVFLMQIGMISASMNKKKLVQRLENKKRQRMAFAIYGLN